MTTQNEQPKFWLQVREEYIFDNFNSLINYLKQYTYLSEHGTNVDYNATLQCMTDLSARYADRLRATPFYKRPEFDKDTHRILRLFCATILASRKAGITPWNIIAATVELAARIELKINSDEVEQLYKVMLNCIRQRQLKNPGIGWGDISEEKINIDIIGFKLAHMTFDSATEDESVYIYENKGTLLVPTSGTPLLSATNLIKLKQLDTAEFATIPNIFSVVTDKADIEKNMDFDKMYKLGNELLARQLKVTPSPAMQLLSYDENDEFPVRVTAKRGQCIVVETIDPKYTKLRGNLYISAGDQRPTTSLINDLINVGDILFAYQNKNGNCIFDSTDTFEDFYIDYASSFAGEEAYALITRRDSGGLYFVTAEGIRGLIHISKLNNLDSDQLDHLENAYQNQEPIPIKFYTQAQKPNRGRFKVYAELNEVRLSYGNGEEIPSFTAREADTFLIKEFLGQSAEEAGGYSDSAGAVEYAKADSGICQSLLSMLFHNIQLGAPSTIDRHGYLVALSMLSRMLDKELEFDYSEHERRYLRTLVDFAQNRPISPMAHDRMLDGVPQAAEREIITQTLSDYIKKVPVEKATAGSVARKENLSTKIRALVSASNNLIDIIDETELNTIKQNISRALDVEDEYVPILDERTYYGIESINLEFKTSVVFPPANRRRVSTMIADPLAQKWNIIKAVNGFLNTRAGGELIIGVRDNGYAQGVESDINELFRLNIIPVPDIDHYRTYIQNFLDLAFREEGTRGGYNKDIARSSVTFVTEKNAEGYTVLHIKIAPYSKSIVELAAPANERPDWTDSSYVRLSGRTVPITDNIRGNVCSYKRR